MNRRQLLASAGAMLAQAALPRAAVRGESARAINKDVIYGNDTLPPGIRSNKVDTNTGVTLHTLEAGRSGAPCVVLLHGFPELAYTWRNQLLPLAAAGFHVIAPDLRGYGRSSTQTVRYEDDLLPYSMLNRVSDVVGLVRALGYETVAAVVGHDWGGPTAQWCARVRPDIFRSVVSMSTPFLKPPTLPLGVASDRANAGNDLDKELAALPRPRKHYFTYSATREANNDMWHAKQGVHDFLRALYHYKSADWEGNKPVPLASWSAAELAKMPEYYIMDLHKGFAETMAAQMPSQRQIANCSWMTEEDLRVYSAEFSRTGFQGGLNYYRVANDPRLGTELKAFSARTIDVPACYIGGDRDWATYQSPGAFESMRSVCSQSLSIRFIKQAGHSLAEERPQQVNEALLEFLARAPAASHSPSPTHTPDPPTSRP
ncbi:alpha/beta fold hydrolase [Steroidobacter flavus]|uniref:Alpha/beta fold hydrolase n=1 Tax=Steroidobacter flavus TaxID=1842136 RepID=A0ABV8SYI8_9GAMM